MKTEFQLLVFETCFFKYWRNTDFLFCSRCTKVNLVNIKIDMNKLRTKERNKYKWFRINTHINKILGSFNDIVVITFKYDTHVVYKIYGNVDGIKMDNCKAIGFLAYHESEKSLTRKFDASLFSTLSFCGMYMVPLSLSGLNTNISASFMQKPAIKIFTRFAT